MVLHVTGAEAVDLLAFELVEEVARVLAQGVDQQVETAAVGHADDDFLGAVGAGALDDLVDHRDHALATLQTEALGARELGAQVLLQPFGSRQALEQVALGFGGELRTAAHAFQTLLEPLALLGIDDVGELRTDGTAVGALQGIADFAQGRFLLADEQLAGMVDGIQIGVGQSVVMDRQIGRRLALPQTQRVQLGCLMATHAEGLNQTQHFDLLLLMLAAHRSGGYRLGAALVLGQQHEVIADRGMGNVGRLAAVGRQLLEVGAPLFGHSVGIVQEELVEFFDVGSVSTGQVGTVPHPLHYAFMHARSPSVRGHHLARRPQDGSKVQSSDFGKATTDPADGPGSSPVAPAGRFLIKKPQLCEPRLVLQQHGAAVIRHPVLTSLNHRQWRIIR
ncbi:hypothetical protein D3C84_404900 [compost metagenome]